MYAPLTPPGGERSVVGYICPLIFLLWSTQNTNFLRSQERKLDTFFDPKNAETFMCKFFQI